MKKFVLWFFCIPFSPHAFSQEAKTDLNQVTITASKFIKHKRNTGKNITVISREELEENAGGNAAQILNNVSGIYIPQANLYPGSNLSLYMHGADAGNTLILIDGIPMNDPGQITNDFDLNLISTNQIERIEILKSASSTLYGSNAAAGVINIITKKGAGKPISVNAQTSVGSYKDFRNMLNISGNLNVFNYNLSLNQRNAEGFSSAKDTTNCKCFDNDGVRQYGINFNSNFHIANNLNIKSFIYYNHMHADLDLGAWTDSKNYTSLSKNLQTGTGLDYIISKYTDGHAIYSFSKIQRGFDNSETSFYSHTSGPLHFADGFIKSRILPSLEILGGISYRHMANKRREAMSNINPDSARSNISEAYVSAFLDNFYNFGIELSSRISSQSLFGGYFTYTINPSYNISDDTKIYINISSAFNAPSLYQLYSPYGNTSLKPEKTRSFEAGIKTSVYKRKGFASLNFFGLNTKDVINFESTDSAPWGKYINRDRQNTNGIEAQIEYPAINSIVMKAWYTFVHGQIINNKNNAVENYLLRRPEHSGNIKIVWNINKSLYLSADFRIIGKRMDLYYSNTLNKTVLIKLHPYATADLFIRYNMINWLDIFASFKNITNARYTEISGYNTYGFNFLTGLNLNL